MKLSKAEISRLRKVQDGIDRKIQKTPDKAVQARLEQQWRDIEHVISGRVATHVKPKKEATETQLKKLDALELKVEKHWGTERGRELKKKYDAMYKKLLGHREESSLPAELKSRVKKLASAVGKKKKKKVVVVKKAKVVKKKKPAKKTKKKVQMKLTKKEAALIARARKVAKSKKKPAKKK